MDSDLKHKLEEANYRTANEGEPSCIHCINSDDNTTISDEGIITSLCYIFHMKVDEFHKCDLIH